MGCFPVMVAAELRKLRGTALLPIGAVSGAAAIGISLYLAAADTTTAYTFPLFAGNVIANTMEELLPFTAALVVGQMMERERSCGTLKNILAVPVSFRRLLAAKLAAGAWLVVLYALLQWGLSLAACALLGLPGLTGGSAAWALGMLLGNDLCVYAALLPVLALAAQFAGGYAAGIGFALFYGFCGVIATGHGWTALYPPTAGTVLLRFRMDPTPRELACAALSLLASLGLAVALTACARDRSGEKREEISEKAE